MAKAKGAGARGALGRFNFAHLIGGAPKTAAEDAPEEKDEDAPEGTEDDAPEGEGEDEPESTEGDEPEAEGEDEPEGEGEEDDTEAAAFAAVIAAAEARGAAKERERCASIFGSQHAAGRIGMAAELAFNTGLDVKTAVGVLAQSPAEKKGGGLAAAMAQQKNPALGNGGTGSKGTQSADSRLVQRAAEMFAPKKTG